MLILASITLALLFLGVCLERKLSQPPLPPEPTLRANQVSIIIPARNEEHNLPRLLNSLASQSDQPLEIIVVDDHSTDRTAELATAAGAKVITAKALPDGWRGKTWACHQGAEAANGEAFLFLDADTWFEPNGFTTALAHYQSGALSICPWHRTDRLYESFSLFFNLAMVVGTAPQGLFGQMLLIDRDSYQKAGGHEAVKSLVLENVHLKQNLHANNIPTLSFTGRKILSFQMYPSGMRDLIEGWTKGFASGAQKTPAITMLTLIGWMTGLMFTLIAPNFAGCDGELEMVWSPLIICSMIQLFWLGSKVGRFNSLLIILYPIPLIFFFGLFTWSAIKGGKNVSWKGRAIDAG